jgi:transcription antitermination factor NusG
MNGERVSCRDASRCVQINSERRAPNTQKTNTQRPKTKKEMTNKETYTNQLSLDEPRWFAIYTNFKREKLVNKMLLQKGIENYLPLQKLTRRYSRKVRAVELPLISGYVFVKIVKNQYIPVLETDHVLKFIRFSKNLLAIPESEIDLIKRVVGEGMEITMEPITYQEGDEVEIVGGNLTGLRGKLISKDGKKQFTIELNNLGYSLYIRLFAFFEANW